jgi:hypothetical protein
MTAIESLGLASTSGMYQPKAPAGLDEYKLTRETYIQKLMSLFSKRG